MSKQESDYMSTGLEIAVIGMAGRFPGARNIHEFWNNLKNGVESISFFSDEELIEEKVGSGLLEDANYVKAGSFLENVEYFDALFFDYTAREGQMMDPQFRFLHECSWEALEAAGYHPEYYNGIIGMYVGSALSADWITRLLVGLDASSSRFEASTFYNRNFLCTRVSYKLNLNGPSFTVQTACSTSLVAIHLACQGLIGGECHMALAGGVSIMNLKKFGYLYEEGMIISPDGHCRVFDARANGAVFGDGIGVVVLKLLESAVNDGDSIYAVILGSAINNDGSMKVGYTAPGTKGEAAVIKAALHAAEVQPESISYVETHGTGTHLGDLIEIKALKRAFNTKKKRICGIGSVKSNVGHLNSAAGVAGFIKTVLALKHRLIPPTLHFETPNPNIDLENSPFYVIDRLTEWKSNGNRLRAGVSSFGIGGTNAHVVLEEWPTAQDVKSKAQHEKHMEQDARREYRLILLSAKTQSALEQMTTNLVDHLKENPDLRLADAAYTLQVGRKVFPHRRMLVVSDVKEVIRALSSPGSEKVLTFQQEKDNRSAVFMFPGLGAQYVNMGLELYQSEMIFRQEMDRCFNILNTLVDEDIKEILYPTHPASSGRPSQEGSKLAARNLQPAISFEKINQPGIAQLVIFIVEYSLARLLNKWGIMPRAIIGYSFGEYAAACIAGVFSLEDALKLVVFRGKLVEKIPPGAMSSMPLPRNQLEPLVDDRLSIAIDNGSSCVVSGPLEAVAALEKQMKEKRCLCMRLPVSHALHSKMMEPILEEFKAFLRQIPLNKPQIPFISNVTGQWIKDREAADPEYWSSHLRQMVKFADGLTELVKEPGSLFIEVGPGHELSALLARQLGKDRQQQVINLLKHPDRDVSDSYFLLSKIGLLWLYGLQIDWSAYYLNEKRYRIPLPTFPFERQRYWVEVGDEENFLPAKYKQKKSDIADWFYLPQWERSQLLPMDRRTLPGSSCWLVFIDETVFCSKLAEQLSLEVKNLITVVKGSAFQKLGESKYKINPTQSDDYRILWEELQKINHIPQVIIHLWSLSDSDGKILEKEIVDDALDSGLYSILYLVQAINQQAFLEGIDICMVLNGIHEVTGEEIIIPQNATVIGLTKVIPQEYSHINCRCIDIELPEAGSVKEEKLIHQLDMEFKSNSKDNIAAYRLDYRWVQTFKSLRLETGDEDQSKLRKDGTYLIIGGLGNVGFTLAKYLAATVSAKLTLTGRTELPPRSEWERYLNSHDKKDPAAVKICRMLELEEMGGEVTFFSTDAGDYQKMLQIIAASEAKFGKINGIIHAAASGGSANRAIDEIGKKEFQHQFQAKVYGLIVLEKLFRGKELDFCLLISSPASILGGLGLAAYAAANQFIDTFVYWHNRIHFDAAPWITVNWGDWLFENEDNGDINISVKDPLAYLRMTPEQGIKTFQKILTGCPVNQVVVSAVDLQERINDWVRIEFKQEKHKSRKNISTTAHNRPHLLTPYVAPGSQMEKIISDIWEKHFGIEKVGVNDNFFELGATSLDLIQLNRKLKEVIRKDLHVGTFFKYPNIHSLALHLSQEEKSQTALEDEVKRSDKVLRKREKIQDRIKISKSVR